MERWDICVFNLNFWSLCSSHGCLLSVLIAATTGNLEVKFAHIWHNLETNPHVKRHMMENVLKLLLWTVVLWKKKAKRKMNCSHAIVVKDINFNRWVLGCVVAVGVLRCISYTGMFRPKRYGFWLVLVRKWGWIFNNFGLKVWKFASLLCAPRATKWSIVLAPVVQKLDSAIHRINNYPVDTK